ncbi:putative 2-aminoethylphosphonate ABC transporter substrate-binding protein [Paraburkholderia aromaticivorans]|uniref:putative 2-aminoethylphosphonate ABC transporter substrate-binding protein n=1 Tax=Paraburkholderia aromaticivorans TaxID=2026199 RepID=UPI001455E060|nr:putative 2-aminoethylphosphonate ABC transporter substrate-binding protein [Paraburkholderia aromaticivorans]
MKRHWLKALWIAASITTAGTALAEPTELTVYTAFETDDLKAYKQAFEAKYPDIRINWVRDSTGVIAAKLLAEKGNEHADAIWGLSVTDVEQLKKDGVIAPYTPAEAQKIPAKFKDSDQPPSWVGTNGYVAAIIYNTVEGKKKNIPQPTTWEDLIKPVYKGQIVMPDPASSGTGFLCLSGWIQAWGEAKAWAYMDKLNENISQYAHSGSAPAVQAGRGEAVVGIAFELRGARLLQDGAPITVTLPTDALGWDLNAVAVIKGSPHLADAQKLEDWATSEEAMKLYGKSRVVIAMPQYGAKLDGLPADETGRLLVQDFGWAAKNRERIIQEFEKRYGAKAQPKS